MKLNGKLIICNIVFCVIIAVIALTGLFYVVDFSDKDYTVSYSELVEIRKIFGELRTSELSEEEAVVEAIGKLNARGYSFFFYPKEGTEIKTDCTSDSVKAVVDKYYDANNEQSIICIDGMMITSMELSSGWLVAVDAEGFTGEHVKMYYIIYIASVVVASICMTIAITAAERIMIVPRLKALTHAMKEVFRGNYERVMTVDTKNQDELGIICAEFDMLRKRLRDSEREKEMFDREKGAMISGISHDLRTPLSIIKGYSKGIMDGVAGRVGREQEYITKIYETSVQMNGLIDKLSAFAKMQSREVMYTFQEHDICDVVNDFIHRNYVQYSARGIRINGIVPQDKRLIANMDKVQFDRIFQNICDNSLKYKVVKTANMIIKVVDRGGTAEIYLSDDGPGINDFEAEYIFENYYRGDPSRTNPVSGSGLGLSIVKSVVVAHKGTVEAYNDNGLTIKITIPIRRKK